MPPKPLHLALRQRVLRVRFAGPGRARARPCGCDFEPLRQRRARSRCGAPCAAPASSRRAARGSCRTARRSRPPRSAGRPAARATRPGARRAPTIATPPITSEWPFRYLVVECTTMSKPSSSGRCTNGLAKVLSATAISRARGQICGQRAQVDQLSSGLARRLDPQHLGLGPDRRAQRLGVGQVDEAEAGPRCAGAPGRTAGRCRRTGRRWPPRARRRRAARAPSRSPPARRRTHTPRAPLSRSATQRSNAQRVGLCERP